MAGRGPTKVLETLGPVPARVPSSAEVVAEWESEGIVMQRVLMDVQEGHSAALLINRPVSAPAEEPLPAILCCHGHGP
jgi:hypothetical protein